LEINDKMKYELKAKPSKEKSYVINGREDSYFWPLYGVYNLINIYFFDEEKIKLKSLMILHAFDAFFKKWWDLSPFRMMIVCIYLELKGWQEKMHLISIARG
jgi:hypothetical protein